MKPGNDEGEGPLEEALLAHRTSWCDEGYRFGAL